jgi:phosphate-selective porin OprO/OprP
MTSRLVAAALLLAAPTAATAQAVQEQAAQAGVAAVQDATPPLTAGWQDGFVLQTAGGDYRLVLGMVAQTDGRFSLDDPSPIINTFSLRKFRPTFTGRVGRYFDFKVMPDFGSGQTIVLDAYVDVRFSPAFRLRTGKDKTPLGYELLQGDAFLLFPERALASSLVPNRDVGIQAQGDLFAGRLSYAGGVFNGIPDGTSGSTELDANGSKDLAGRIAVQPFRSALARRPLGGLGFHVGASHGSQGGPLPSFRTSIGQTYFSYAAGTSAGGDRTRVSPALFYYHGPFGVFAEYMRSAQQVSRAATSLDAINTAWEITGSYVITGEPASDRGVRPRMNFDPPEGEWGALQLLARVTELSVDEDVFSAELAAPGASQRARSWTLGVNWYPNPWIKWYATFERTTFRALASAERAAEHAVLVRFQLAF